MLSGKDLVNDYAWGRTLTPAARTSTGTGTGIDMADTGPELYAILENGTTSGTSPTLDVKIQESDDNSTYSDITGAAFTQLTAAGGERILVRNRTKRYVRALGTIGGSSTPTFTYSVLICAPKKSY
jgi:hypothetical protein